MGDRWITETQTDLIQDIWILFYFSNNFFHRGRTLTRKSSKDQNGSVDRQITTRNRSSSWHRSLSNDRVPSRSGSGSRERTLYLRRSNSTEQLPRSSLNGSAIRGRSSSFDRNTSGNRSRLSAASGGNRSRTPSPAGKSLNC